MKLYNEDYFNIAKDRINGAEEIYKSGGLF